MTLQTRDEIFGNILKYNVNVLEKRPAPDNVAEVVEEKLRVVSEIMKEEETLKMRMMLEQRIRNLLMRESLTGRKCSLCEARCQFYAQVFRCYNKTNELCKI